MKNKRYLCYQELVIKEQIEGSQNDIQLDVVIRNVGAINEDEALGKFIKETSKIKASN